MEKGAKLRRPHHIANITSALNYLEKKNVSQKNGSASNVHFPGSHLAAFPFFRVCSARFSLLPDPVSYQIQSRGSFLENVLSFCYSFSPSIRIQILSLSRWLCTAVGK